MKTDSLFYNIFLAFPETFFELIGLPATVNNQYQFTSREVKQLSFRLDGLFYPKLEQPGQTFYVVEVQFQPDPDLYYRIFGELFLFLRQYKPLPTWSVVIIYPNSRVAREFPEHFQGFLHRVRVIYLDELPENNDSLGVELLKIIREDEESLVTRTRSLISQAKIKLPDEIIQRDFIELIEKILVYKLPSKSREEIEAMFGLEDFKQTRFYQEAKAEGKLEGIAEGKLEGIAEGEASLILRLLKRKFGQLSPSNETLINQLSLTQLEDLGEALLDFQQEQDLLDWLTRNKFYHT